MKNLRFINRYLRDKGIPLYKRIFIGASVLGGFLYIALPVDIITDFLLGVGWVDDGVVAALVLNALRTELADYGAKFQVKKQKEAKILPFESKKKD